MYGVDWLRVEQYTFLVACMLRTKGNIRLLLVMGWGYCHGKWEGREGELSAEVG